MKQAHVAALKRVFGDSPMTDRQQALLEDIKSFIDIAIENGLSFQLVIGTLAHDVNGILAPGDLFERDMFRPKVHGYSRAKLEAAAEAKSMASDPSMKSASAQEE